MSFGSYIHTKFQSICLMFNNLTVGKNCPTVKLMLTSVLSSLTANIEILGTITVKMSSKNSRFFYLT